MLKREWNEIGPAKWKIPFHSTYENFGTSNRKFWSNGTCPKILGLLISRHMRALVFTASRDIFDVDAFHKDIQYSLEKLGKSKFGFERTVVSKFKSK